MTDRLKAARHAEIARRYRWHSHQNKRVSLAALRVYELTNLLRSRYGRTLPDDDAGRDDARIMAHHLAAMSGDPRRRITPWLRQWAPWMTIGEADEVLVEAMTKPKRWRADKLAWRLRVTMAERNKLRLTTIGAIDMSKAERAKRRRSLNIAAKTADRRAKGAKPRAQYLAEIAAPKPWAALGMSRAKWYRAGKPAPP